MYFGHATWITVVVFGAMFALRMLSQQRRRGARRGYPGNAFLSGPRRPPGRGPMPDTPVPDGVGVAAGASGTGTPPGWFHDPFVRHEFRYWSGSEWTDHVTDQGAPGLDPPPDASSHRRA